MTIFSRRLMPILLVIALSCAPETRGEALAAADLTPAQIADGWIALFDSETLFGWRPTSKANWRVDEGEIRVDSGDPGWLMTSVDWADYDLHVEFKAPADTNSGLFLRSAENPTDPTSDCIEINIAPRDNDYPTPSIVGRWKTPLAEGGWARDKNTDSLRQVAASQMPNAWDGNWHSLDVVLVGNSIEVSLDGVILSRYLSEERNYGLLGEQVVGRGRIGLQFRQGPVAFRNVRLRPRAAKSLFNGRDLTGWNTDRAEASEFSVTPEGELHIVNGRGQIESDASFGDFVLQLDCFVNGDGLNSGVFFRSIPREFTNGYESQIQNAVVDGDPTKPVDCGTGGIYRRVNARRVNARDREWFTKTINASGPNIAVWVNGLQVTDWTDTRAPHPNPRNGLRIEPGTLSLQGHDPTTDLRFRNIRISDYAKLKGAAAE